jgi:hypothetical protein
MHVFETRAAGLLILAMLVVAATVRADEWDVGNDTDNAITTDNSLFHGAEQVHDLAAVGGVADQDWFLLSGRKFSSYQIVVDGVTGDLDLGAISVQLMNDAGVVIGQGEVTDSGSQVMLNHVVFSDRVDYIRVQGAACNSSCTSQARYRIRFYDTTYTVPRFNNSGSQSTVLLVLNTTDRSCGLAYEFFANDGTRIVDRLFFPSPAVLHVFPLASDPELAGTSGSIRVIQTCGYGGLSGKAVSLEPSTGFTFETPLVPRPH